MRYAIVAVCCLGLAGCAGGHAPDTACEVFDPPSAASPTGKDDQRVQMQSSGDPTAGTAAQPRDCP